MVELAAEGGVAAVEPLLEENKEEDRRRGSSMASGLAPPEVPELEEGRPVGPGFWHGGQDAREAVQEAPISEKARGKVPAVEPPPLEMDEELAQHLQREEYVAEEAKRGQDAATLVVVREATGPLMQGQLEGLWGPS